MGSLPIEVLRILFLDRGRRPLADEQLQHGTLAQLAIYPRTIFRRALELNAAAIILIHNHPSGHARPRESSEARRVGTERVCTCRPWCEPYLEKQIKTNTYHINIV